MAIEKLADFPPRADILTEIYQPLPKLTAVIDWETLDSSATAEKAVRSFATALETADTNALGDVFLTRQSFWRDTVAITSHLRTFEGREVIASVLTELNNQRRISEITLISGTPQVAVVSDTLVGSPTALARNVLPSLNLTCTPSRNCWELSSSSRPRRHRQSVMAG